MRNLEFAAEYLFSYTELLSVWHHCFDLHFPNKFSFSFFRLHNLIWLVTFPSNFIDLHLVLSVPNSATSMFQVSTFSFLMLSFYLFFLKIYITATSLSLVHPEFLFIFQHKTTSATITKSSRVFLDMYDYDVPSLSPPRWEIHQVDFFYQVESCGQDPGNPKHCPASILSHHKLKSFVVLIVISSHKKLCYSFSYINLTLSQQLRPTLKVFVFYLLTTEISCAIDWVCLM